MSSLQSRRRALRRLLADGAIGIAAWRAAGSTVGATIGAAGLAASRPANAAPLLEDVVERLLLAELPRMLGPADRYAAKVRGAWPDGSLFQQIDVSGERVARAGNPVLDRLQATLREVEVDVGRQRVDSIGGAQVEVRLRAGDIAGFLRRQGWVDGATAGFTGRNGIVVVGRPVMAGYTAPALGDVEFRGRLLPQGSQLRLTVDAVRIAGFEATELTRSVLEGTINPLFDASAYAAPTRIDSAQVQGDAMVITASGSRVVPAGQSPATNR